MRLLSGRILVASVAAVAGLNALAGPPGAAMRPAHWQNPGVRWVMVEGSVGSVWAPMLKTAMDDWNAVNGGMIGLVPDSNPREFAANGDCEPRPGQIRICAGTMKTANWALKSVNTVTGSY